jgi:hypothetical protein
MKNIPSNNPSTRALIVEDSEINAVAAQSTLKRLNCQADIADCGNAAL